MLGVERVRLGEILAALSLATDLGNGFAPEKSLRTTLIAVRIADELGLVGAELRDVWYTAILRFVGCTAMAYAMGEGFPDDVRMRHTFAAVDQHYPRESMRAMGELTKGLSPLGRAATIARLARSNKIYKEAMAADCEVISRIASRIPVGPAVAVALPQIGARHDGKGFPKGLRGESIVVPARILLAAHFADVRWALGGREAARKAIRRGRGGWFDPTVADAFLTRCDALFDEIEAGSVWDLALAAEPEPNIHVRSSELDDLARVFADFADLKSPYTLGHSSGVAALAEAGARALAMSEEEVTTIRRAALFHDLGRVAVANGVWLKRGPLAPAEWEQVRLHAYHTERTLARSPLLAPLAAIAGMHHERLDGSGYHRAAPASIQDRASRLLAAADVFHALTEERPHRAAFAAADAANEVKAMVVAGLLDRDASEAVCAAAGHATRIPKQWPAGLTDREVEVLGLIARGMSKKEVAELLSISPSTAHTHVVHLYGKIGVSTRAAAAMFAMENGLVRAGGGPLSPSS